MYKIYLMFSDGDEFFHDEEYTSKEAAAAEAAELADVHGEELIKHYIYEL